MGGVGTGGLPHPCVKVLVYRRIGARWRRRPQFQEVLPRRLRSHLAKREREGEPRRLVPGPCGEPFLRVLDEACIAKEHATASDSLSKEPVPPDV